MKGINSNNMYPSSTKNNRKVTIGKGLQTSSGKGHRVNILGFAGHTVSFVNYLTP